MHELDCNPGIFRAIAEGKLRFWLQRYAGIELGDVIKIREKTDDGYTGRNVYAQVTFIVADPDRGLAPGFVCFSFKQKALSGFEFKVDDLT